jgi:O-antigen/teichoic acid export membrane protein
MIYGFASVLGKMVAVFLLPIYTSVLSQEEFGAMAMIVSAKGIIDLFSNLNIHSGVTRDYYEKSIDRSVLVSTGIFSILFFSILTFLVLFLTRGYWINILNIAGHEKAFIVMLLSLPAGNLYAYFGVLTRFKKKPVHYSIGALMLVIIQAILTIYFILYLKTGIVGVFYGMLGGEIIAGVYFFILNKEYIAFTFNRNLLKRVLIYSLPVLPGILSGWVDSSVGQILIGKFISLSDAGIYSIALRIASVYLLMQIALRNVWLPFVFEKYHETNFKRDILRLFHALTIILIIVSVNLSLLSDYIVLLLSNQDYIDAGKYLILLTIPKSALILFTFVGIGPSISRNTKYVSYAFIAGGVINLAMILFLIPVFGVIIVPLALGISKIISYFLISHYTFKEIGLFFPPNNVIILIVCVMGCYALRLMNINALFTFALIIVINLGAIIYIYKHFNLHDVILKKLAKNTPS